MQVRMGNRNIGVRSAVVAIMLGLAVCGALPASADESIENIFVIGGTRVFVEAMNQPRLDGIYLTRIKKDYHCDVFFPPLGAGWTEQALDADEEGGVIFEYKFYFR